MAFVLGRGFVEIGLDDKSALSGLSAFSSKLGGITKGAIAGLAGISTGIAAIGAASIAAASRQEQAEKKLAAALDLTNDATQENLSELKAFAAELQTVTTLGDETILSQMAFAKSLGVSTEHLQDVTKAAIGLSKRLDVDLHTAMQLIARGVQGQFQLFSRYGIALDETMTDQEKLNKVIEFGTKGFQLAKADTETFAGSLQQLKNTVGDLSELIGKPLIDGLSNVFSVVNKFITENPLDVYINDAIDGLQALLDAASETASGIIGAFGPVATYFRDVISRLLQVIEEQLVSILINTGFGGAPGEAQGRAAVSRSRVMSSSDIKAIEAVVTKLQDVAVKSRRELRRAQAGTGRVMLQGAGAAAGATAKQEQIKTIEFPRFDLRSEEERKLAELIEALEKQNDKANAFLGLDEAFRQFSTAQDTTAKDQLEIARKQLEELQRSRELQELISKAFDNGPTIKVL